MEFFLVRYLLTIRYKRRPFTVCRFHILAFMKTLLKIATKPLDKRPK